MPESAPGTLGTLNNAATVLDLLSDGPSHHQLSDLAERSQLSLATVHRLLRSLVAAGLAEQDPLSSRYGLGPELVRLAERYVARLPIVEAAAPHLIELRARTGETVVLATLSGTDVLYLDRIDGDDLGGVYLNTRRSRPAVTSAAGRLLAAHADDGRWEEMMETSVSDPSERRRLRSLDHMVLVVPPPLEHVELAAPVHGASDAVDAAIAVITRSLADGQGDAANSIISHLRQAATAISRTLSHV